MGIVFACVLLVFLYIGLVIYDFQWLSASDTDLERYAKQHYPTEIANLPQTADETKVFPLGLITELQVRRSTEAVPDTTAGSASQAGWGYRADIRWIQWLLLTVVYVTLSGVAVYAVWVFSIVFQSDTLRPIPSTDDVRELETNDVRRRELAWRVLSNDVENVQRLIQEVDRRSVLFLIIGSIFGILGVGVLLTALPHEVRPGETAAEIIVSISRSLALAVFVETIAWFFLKQHRILIEDRKSLFRLYLRRANYITSLGLLPVNLQEAPELRTAVISALLRDPVIDRLRQGETTEALEALRALGNPGAGALAEMLALLKDYLPKPTLPSGAP